MELTRNQQIGERIRTAREHYNLSHKALAALTDGAISASRLANYESGLRRPGIEEAEALARALGDVSAAWLLTLEDGSPSASARH
jgi:transcriptional regulator with XRE-family HTH domain